MVQLSIPPSRIAQAIKNATCTAAKDPERVIFCDRSSDTAVIAEKANRKVINVGRAGDVATMDEMPPEDPDEDDEDDDDFDDENDEEIDEAVYSNPKSANTIKSYNSESISGLKKALRSEDVNRVNHIRKLVEYRKNPDAQDNRNLLKSAGSNQFQRRRIIRTRIKELKTQIRGFKCKLSVIRSVLRRKGGI